MPYLHQYKIFVSHAWQYHQQYEKLIEFLNAANNFSFANCSVPENKGFAPMPKYQLEEKMRAQIRPSQIVIILGGMYVAHSEWIQFEIDFAKSSGKPILGVIPWGQERVPLAVQNSAHAMVGWNTDSIVSQIRSLVA